MICMRIRPFFILKTMLDFYAAREYFPLERHTLYLLLSFAKDPV